MADAPAPAAPEEPKKKGGMPILLIVNAVLLLGVLGAVLLLVTKKPAAAAPAGGETEASAPKEGGHEAPKEGHGGGKEGGGSGGHEGGGHESKGGDKGGPTPIGAGPTLRLADFVVHLRNPESDRYARFSFEIEIASEKDKETLTARTAQVRDAFIIFLSDRTVEELRGGAGLDKLKQALFERLLEVAKDCHVRNLYITDFVLQ
jgi:flagellar FliL protein